MTRESSVSREGVGETFVVRLRDKTSYDTLGTSVCVSVGISVRVEKEDGVKSDVRIAAEVRSEHELVDLKRFTCLEEVRNVKETEQLERREEKGISRRKV